MLHTFLYHRLRLTSMANILSLGGDGSLSSDQDQARSGSTALFFSLANKRRGYEVSGGRNKPLWLTAGQLLPPDFFARWSTVKSRGLLAAEKLIVSLSHRLVCQWKIHGPPISLHQWFTSMLGPPPLPSYRASLLSKGSRLDPCHFFVAT